MKISRVDVDLAKSLFQIHGAEAICEAMSRPSMGLVRAKSVEQQDIQAIHRVPSEMTGNRTAKANQI